jgi:oligopeptidase B
VLPRRRPATGDHGEHLPVLGQHLHDPRVLIHEPAKWAAKLRAAGTGGRLLFRPELGPGAHTGPAGRYARLRYEAEILAFIVSAAR